MVGFLQAMNSTAPDVQGNTFCLQFIQKTKKNCWGKTILLFVQGRPPALLRQKQNLLSTMDTQADTGQDLENSERGNDS